MQPLYEEANFPVQPANFWWQLAAEHDLSDMRPIPQSIEVEDDCEFVPYFDEDQVPRRLDEVPEENTVGSMVGNRESLKLFEIYGSHVWSCKYIFLDEFVFIL